jgi:hypothetical protein
LDPLLPVVSPIQLTLFAIASSILATIHAVLHCLTNLLLTQFLPL